MVLQLFSQFKALDYLQSLTQYMVSEGLRDRLEMIWTVVVECV